MLIVCQALLWGLTGLTFHPQGNPRRWGPLLSPFYSQRIWGSEKWSDFPKDTEGCHLPFTVVVYSYVQCGNIVILSKTPCCPQKAPSFKKLSSPYGPSAPSDYCRYLGSTLASYLKVYPISKMYLVKIIPINVLPYIFEFNEIIVFPQIFCDLF